MSPKKNLALIIRLVYQQIENSTCWHVLWLTLLVSYPIEFRSDEMTQKWIKFQETYRMSPGRKEWARETYRMRPGRIEWARKCIEWAFIHWLAFNRLPENLCVRHWTYAYGYCKFVFGLIASIQPIWVVSCSRLVDKLMSTEACSYSDCLIDSHISAHGEYLYCVLQMSCKMTWRYTAAPCMSLMCWPFFPNLWPIPSRS